MLGARSLKDVCITLLNINLVGLTDIGDMDYQLLRPVLLNIDNAKQLHELEENSPQIVGLSGEIWRRMIGKHFEKKLIESQGELQPKKPGQWWKVYEHLEELKQEEQAAAEDFLRRKMAEHNQAREANTIKAPTQFLKPKSSTTTHWSSSYGSAPRPRTAMARIKRATANVAANRRVGASGVTCSTPSFRARIPPANKAGITHAPRHMIDAARKTEEDKSRRIEGGAGGGRRIPIFRAPPQASSTTATSDPFSRASVLEREARLNRLKMGSSLSAPEPAQALITDLGKPSSRAPVTNVGQPAAPTSFLSPAAARQQQNIRRVAGPASRVRETAAAPAARPQPHAAVPAPRPTPHKRPAEASPINGEGVGGSPKRKKPANDSFLRSASRPSIGRGRR